MIALTNLEMAALQAIFRETPELAPALELQLMEAIVSERRNSDGGFFTTMKVGNGAPAVNSPSLLGHATHANVCGLERGISFVLFLKSGFLHMLEGISYGEGTRHLDLTALQFEIYNQPVQHLSRAPRKPSCGHR